MDVIRLIVIEESANEAEVILNNLRKARYPIRPRYIKDKEDLQEALSKSLWDLIISVSQVAHLTVLQTCQIVSKSKQDIPIILLVDKLKHENINKWLSAGITRILLSSNKACLPFVVGKELDNLTKRRRIQELEQLYKESQEYNKMLLESSHDAIAYVQDGIHIYANPAYLKIFNYKSMDDLEGLPIMELITKANLKLLCVILWLTKIHQNVKLNWKESNQITNDSN